jgi:hypothetical protein
VARTTSRGTGSAGSAGQAHARGVTEARSRQVAAECPLRPGHPCTLCHPEAHLGPQDCPTVAIVRDDPELAAEAARLRAVVRAAG